MSFFWQYQSFEGCRLKGISKMSMRKILFLLVPVLILAAGCSKAPESELTSTEKIIQEAQDAEADQYVPEMYQMAVDSLDAAKTEIRRQDGRFTWFRSYGKSRETLQAAQKLAEEAAGQAQVEKDRMRAEVSQMITQADTVVTTVTKAYASVAKGKGARADLRTIKADLDAVQTSYRAAVEQFNNGKYLVAKCGLDLVMKNSAAIIEAIGAAGAIKK
jgi:uncharacterized lipoprotein YajG